MKPHTLVNTITATGTPENTAVAWVHSGALLAHATHTGLLPVPPTNVQAGLEKLATTYPQLSALADPHVNPAMGHNTPTELADQCATQPPPLDPDPNREMGHALGELYQNLSTESRKGRALCQTPWWVTRLLLDLAYDPAYEQWGTNTRAIDPACGTGHILVETLVRASISHQSGLGRSSRGTSPTLPMKMPADAKMAHALNSVHGVDLDPYAAVVARYRLIHVAVMLMRSHRVTDPTNAVRGMPVNVTATNSLLDTDEPLLARGQYHTVLANPPYITPKDPTIRDQVRQAYRHVCPGQYALSVPFEPLMHELCVPGGYVTRITANSFMKREFGKKLIEDYFAKQVDLTWVIDTSGAYIPGHGTPTVILVSRNQPPTKTTVTAIRGNRGEPRTPEDPSRGLVWSAIEKAVHEKLSYQRLAAGIAAYHGTPLPEPEPVADKGADVQMALFPAA